MLNYPHNDYEKDIVDHLRGHADKIEDYLPEETAELLRHAADWIKRGRQLSIGRIQFKSAGATRKR